MLQIFRVAEVEMVGWHHQLKGHELSKPQEMGEGQGRLVCYGPCYHKELDMI